MSGSDDEGRRFTDDEAKEILRRAVDVDQSRAGGLSEGVSLSELKAIGEEVGIAPEAVDHAARSLRRNAPSPRGGFFGGPRSVEAEGYAGLPLDPGSTAEVLALIRGALGRKGQATEIHGSVEWAGGSELVEEYVTLAPSEGSTVVRAGANLSGLVNLMFGLPLTLSAVLSVVGFITAVDEASVVGMLISLLLVPAVFLVLRVVYGAVVRSEATKLEELVEVLVDEVGDG
ncbi:MAG: hypothetical protein KJO65_03405 [Gemmatimonadetes bacterium]|nr:hypothetical protein [Gemmatimonadota bacterium]